MSDQSELMPLINLLAFCDGFMGRTGVKRESVAEFKVKPHNLTFTKLCFLKRKIFHVTFGNWCYFNHDTVFATGIIIRYSISD